MPHPIWHQVFSDNDRAWQVLTSNGILYRSCKTSQQAYEAVCDAPDVDDYERVVLWKRDAGRGCILRSIDKMAQKRLQDHGPQTPFEEM